MIEIAGLTKKSDYDHISQAAAYASIINIQKNLKASQAKGDENTRSHRAYLLFLINDAISN
jgi:hypothetical protein